VATKRHKRRKKVRHIICEFCASLRLKKFGLSVPQIADKSDNKLKELSAAAG
jgi:hypothetical protein